MGEYNLVLKEFYGSGRIAQRYWQNGTAPSSASVVRMEEIPHDLMTKCAQCGTVLVTKDWLRDLKVCSRCNHHARLTAPERIDLLCDEGAWEAWDADLQRAIRCYSPNMSRSVLPDASHDAPLKIRA
jgi:acetyl-CoA carboxylase carboxyl transferase subunit beta